MNMNLDEVKRYISESSLESRVYVGADSERFRTKDGWYADYAVVVVVHKDGKHGCKVFGEVTRERDYDKKAGRPAIRLMNEVYKVQKVFSQLVDVIGPRHCEVHLDINPQDKYGSSCVVQQAIGYIMGTCNMKPRLKPEAFCASYCADRLKSLMLREAA